MVRRNAESAQFHEAAEPTLERVRRDQGRVSERVRPLMVLIEESLFDAGLVPRLGRRLEILPDDVTHELCEVLGGRPRVYLRERRLDVADRLLRTTQWKVWEIAVKTGFRKARTLAHWFKQRTGKSPSDVRPAPPAVTAEAPRVPRQEHWPQPEVQALVGALEPQAMVALIQRIRSLYPSVPRREPSRPWIELSMPGYRHERMLADAVWEAAHDLPTERLRRVLCQRLRFRSPALFRLLGEKGREIGRRDRKRGVALVELGVEVLEANADAFGESVHDLLTVGWSWTANQRRFALDHSGGEEALGFARQEWETSRTSPDPQAEAELRLIEGTFRLYQRRFAEAFDALTRSIELSRQNDLPELLVKALNQRVELELAHDDNPQMAADDLNEALRRIPDREQQPYLMLSIYTRLIGLYMRLDRLDGIDGLFDAAEPLARSVDNPLVNAQLLWLKGLVCKRRSDQESAEQFLVEAHFRLISEGETCHAAVLALDLMELFVERGLASKARSMAIETIAILESLKLHREILAALRLLRSALETGGIDLIVLAEVRNRLRPLKRFSIGPKA